MTADHRSAHPNIPGVPWWGAVLIAATLTAIGFAYDAGSGAKELSAVFAGAYVVGCILAVLAVRQAGIFTAVIQPPLLLFASVPTAYFLFTDSQISNLKDTLINCAYPLIERFPLMFFTSAVVLLIGMARWYTGMSSHRSTPRATPKDESSGGGLVSAVSSKVSSLLSRHQDGDDEVDEPPRRRSAADRPSRSTRTATSAPSRNGRPASRSTPSRSRHARPPETEIIEPVATDHADPAPAGRPSRRSNHAASHAHRRASDGPHRRRPIAAPVSSAPNVGAASTRASRPRRPAATETGHTTRFRVCATAARTTAKSLRITARGGGPHATGKSKPGSTTSDPRYERAGRISLGSAKTSVSLAVVTGCTTS